MNEDWSYSIVTEIGNGEVPEDILIKGNPMNYNVDELIEKYWGGSIHKNFFPFSYVNGEVVYYNREFNRLFAGHKICYFVWGFTLTDIYDIYTNEFICTVVTDDLVFVSLLSNLYGVVFSSLYYNSQKNSLFDIILFGEISNMFPFLYKRTGDIIRITYSDTFGKHLWYYYYKITDVKKFDLLITKLNLRYQ